MSTHWRGQGGGKEIGKKQNTHLEMTENSNISDIGTVNKQ